MKNIVLPTFYCPFPPQVNPLVEAVNMYTFNWVQRFHLVEKEAARRRFAASRFAWLTARVYPTTGFEELALANDLLVWLFMLDDQFDDGLIGRQVEHTQAILHILFTLVALEGDGQDTSSPLFEGAVAASLVDIWRRLLPRTTSLWRERFFQHVRDYFISYDWETQNRAQGRIPPIDTYIEKRQDTGAMLLALDFIDITEHVSLPDEIYGSAEMQTLMRTTNNAVCWANDIISLEKERARGDVNNLVLAVQYARQCSLQVAVDVVNAMITEQVQLFLETVPRLLLLFPASIQDIEKYVAIMRAWMRGNLDWSFETQRYSHVEQNTMGVSYLESILPVVSNASEGNN
jgi:hypothetical protein